MCFFKQPILEDFLPKPPTPPELAVRSVKNLPILTEQTNKRKFIDNTERNSTSRIAVSKNPSNTQKFEDRIYFSPSQRINRRSVSPEPKRPALAPPSLMPPQRCAAGLSYQREIAYRVSLYQTAITLMILRLNKRLLQYVIIDRFMMTLLLRHFVHFLRLISKEEMCHLLLLNSLLESLGIDGLKFGLQLAGKHNLVEHSRCDLYYVDHFILLIRDLLYDLLNYHQIRQILVR